MVGEIQNNFSVAFLTKKRDTTIGSENLNVMSFLLIMHCIYQPFCKCDVCPIDFVTQF